MLNPLCLALSPVALAVVLFYSWTKRFTALSHLVLGLSLGIAPAAAWIAMTGALDPRIVWLTAAVMLWTAGFDIIYSCQDVDFDRSAGLHSLPARLGVARALGLALYRTRPSRRGLPRQPGPRAPARQRHVLQRQPPHQPHRRLRGVLQALRLRQEGARSQGLHHVARPGVAPRRRRATARRSPSSTSSAACTRN
jgi:hypothetical protein